TMARPAKRLLTGTVCLWQKQWHFGRALAGALAGLMLGLTPRCLAATSGATVGVSATVGPQLAVDGQGAAGSGLVTSATMPSDGIPFQIRVRSNTPWRWSARVQSASGVAVPLSCSYAYRSAAAFDGAPG